MRKPFSLLVAVLFVAACGGTNATPSPPTSSQAAATQGAQPASQAPAGSQPAASAPAGGSSGTLTIAMGGDVETLDPAFTQSQRSNEVIRNIGDQWFHYAFPDKNGVPTYDPSKIDGAAIDSWTVAPDGMSVDVHVRQGMTFHRTGNPVTADDVIYWLDRGKGLNAGPAQNMRLAKIKDWSKKDDYTVHVDLTAPSPLFFYEFRDQASALLDSKDIKAHVTADDPWGKAYIAKTDVFSGSYQIDNYTPGVEMDLSAFPGYWAGQPSFSKVVLKFVPVEAQRVLLLQQGAVDLSEELGVQSLTSLASAPGVAELSLPDRNQMMMGLNITKAPFDKPENRQALAYAVPYDDIIASIFQGQGMKSEGVVPVLGFLHNSSTWPYKFDQNKAKQLLSAAGNPSGYSFTLHIEQGDDTSNKLAVYLQTRLREVGIQMGIQIDSPANFGFQTTLKFDAWMRELLWYVDDPGYIGSYIGSSTTCCFKTGFSPPQLDTIINQLQSLTNSPQDAAKKKDLATQYQQIFNAASPIIFLGDLNFKIAMRSNLQGYHKDADDQLWWFPLSRSGS
jgi:peptide/nickel transport system substrate-binding protein